MEFQINLMGQLGSERRFGDPQQGKFGNRGRPLGCVLIAVLNFFVERTGVNSGSAEECAAHDPASKGGRQSKDDQGYGKPTSAKEALISHLLCSNQRHLNALSAFV